MHKYAVIRDYTGHGLLSLLFFIVHKALNQVLVNYLTCFAVLQLCPTLFNWISLFNNVCTLNFVKYLSFY